MSLNLRFQLIKQSIRGYAEVSTHGAKHSIGGDSRNEVIKRSLFDAPLRKNVPKNEEDLERDRVIEQAWELYVKFQQKKHQSQLNVKYQRMVEASEKLKELSPTLFAASQSSTLNLLFPKQLKIPTLTPANKIWNYDSQKKVTAEREAASAAKALKKKLKQSAKQ